VSFEQHLDTLGIAIRFGPKLLLKCDRLRP
jgi:hypothetical protein